MTCLRTSTSVLLIAVSGGIPAGATAAQKPAVIVDRDLFDGLAPDPRVIEFLVASKASNSRGPCSSTETASGASEPDGWGTSVIEWIETHLLALQTVHAALECNPLCSGHYQGPEWTGGCGIYGLCGWYCASDPTRFDYADGCLDCVVDNPASPCDGCQDDKGCNNPQSPPPPSDGGHETPPPNDP